MFFGGGSDDGGGEGETNKTQFNKTGSIQKNVYGIWPIRQATNLRQKPGYILILCNKEKKKKNNSEIVKHEKRIIGWPVVW